MFSPNCLLSGENISPCPMSKTAFGAFFGSSMHPDIRIIQSSARSILEWFIFFLKDIIFHQSLLLCRFSLVILISIPCFSTRERKGLSMIVHIHSPSRLNSVARVRGCSMDHVRYAHINAQAPRSPRFESGRWDFFYFLFQPISDLFKSRRQIGAHASHNLPWHRRHPSDDKP